MGVVGIGASAGALPALEALLDGLPARPGLAFFVAVHLSAEEEGQLPGLLQRRTDLAVRQVNGRTPLQVDHIYVIPPGQTLAHLDGALHLTLEDNAAPNGAPIDRLFTSLARSHGSRAAGIILSGTGSDGAMGFRHLREKGGYALVQEPSEALFGQMPQAALESGVVDVVLPAGRMGAELARVFGMADRQDGASRVEVGPALDGILEQVKRGTGQDFSEYAESTIRQRIGRRVHLGGHGDTETYLARLREQPREVEALRRDLLLRATGFFRDPDSLLALTNGVITPLLRDSDSRHPIRVWVAGCGTGEEAYSIAILFDEAARALAVERDVRVFASDLSAEALESGRTGRYPQGVALDVSPARLLRYFTPDPTGFRIRRELRQRLVFAQHDLLNDPPFSSLDLVACRDVLGHLNPEARKRVLGLLRFSLKDDGHLFLGSSETLDHAPDLFAGSDPVNRIFRPRLVTDGGVPRGETVPGRQVRRGPGDPDGPIHLEPPSRPSYGLLHQDLVEMYAPPSLVITEEGEVVHLSENAGRFLKLRGGAPSSSLLDLLEADRAAEMRILLDEAFRAFTTARGAPGTFGEGPAARPVVRPFRPHEGTTVFALVLFEPVVEDLPDPDTTSTKGDQDAEREVQYLRERLSQASEAHDRTLQEFRAAYTELQIIYEEQMVTAEELESIREELQSVNEELRTINEEHRTKIEELDCLNADLENLIDAAEVSAVFLDRELRVRSYTPPVTGIFRFRPADLNRAVGEITHALDYPDFVADASRVLTTEERLQREVPAEGGLRYAVRMVPYRSAQGIVDGVVITFLDLTDHGRSQRASGPGHLSARTKVPQTQGRSPKGGPTDRARP